MNIEKIKIIMKQKNLTKYRLAKLTGLSESGLSDIFNGHKKDPRISTVKKIANALEVSVEEII